MAGQLGGQSFHHNQNGQSPLASSKRRDREQAEAKLVTVNHLMVVTGIWLLSIGLFVALFSPALWLTGIFGLTLPALPTVTRWGVAKARARKANQQRNRRSATRRQSPSIRLRVHDWLRARVSDSPSGRDRL